MRRTITLLVALTMLTMGFAAVPSIAQQPDDPGDSGQNGPPDDRPQERMSPEERQAWAQEKREQAMDRAQQAGLFGHLNYEDGHIDGTFIDSNLDEDAGTITDHAVVRDEAHTVLTSVEIAATVDGDATLRPATLSLPFEDGELRINDNPTALVQYRSTASVDVTLTLDDAYSVTVDENATKAKIAGPVNGTILLAGSGNLSANGDTVTASLDEAGNVIFQLRPDEPGQQVSQAALEHAASEDRLGGELRVSGAAGEPVDQDTPVDVDMRAQYANEGQVIVETDGDHDDGRVLHITVTKDNLPVDNAADVAPKIDRQNVVKVNTIDEVINATSDEARAHVAVHATLVEVTIWMPDFSLHSVNIQDATQTIPDIPRALDSPNPTGLGISLAEQAQQRTLQQATQWQDMSMDAQTQATLQAQQAGLFGQATFETATGTMQGTNVQATIDANAGTIENYRAIDGASTLFEQVRPSQFTPSEDIQAMGPAVAVLGEEVAMIAHDTPNGQLEIRAGDEGTHVELDIDPGATVDRVNDRMIAVTTPADVEVHLALVAGDGDLIVEGDTIIANLGANAAAHAIATPSADVPGQANLDERLHAATNGDLGAEASITAVDGTPVMDRVETSVELETQDIGQASVTVTASSQVPDPRGVTLNLDPALVENAPADEIQVLIDGQAAQAADSAAEVLDANDAAVMFYAQDAGEGLQVLVNLDGFSEHDITVQSTGDETANDEDDTTDDTQDPDDGDTEDANDASLLGILGILATVGLAALARNR